MRFSEYLEQAGHGEMKRLERETELGYMTLHRTKRGERIRDYLKAKVLSEATGGKVSIAELCDPEAIPAGDTAPAGTFAPVVATQTPEELDADLDAPSTAA